MDYYEEIKRIKNNFKYLYFSKSNSTLILSNNTKSSNKECIEEIDKSIPFLKKFSHGKIIRQNKKSRADLIKEKWPIIKKEILKKKLDDLVEMKNEKIHETKMKVNLICRSSDV